MQSKPPISCNSLFMKLLDIVPLVSEACCPGWIVCCMTCGLCAIPHTKWYCVDLYSSACLGATVAKKIGGSHEEIQGHIKPPFLRVLPFNKKDIQVYSSMKNS